MPVIDSLAALEILDSRGRPTVQVTCRLVGGATGRASVPSGASRGKAEALELRDGDPHRFGGLGCRKAAQNVEGEIAAATMGQELSGQAELDKMLAELDGTGDKSRLGANALLAVSLAFARACSVLVSVPLYQHFAGMVDTDLKYLPRLTINLFSGGKHAGSQVAIQDVLLVPQSASTIKESLEVTYDVVQSAIDLVRTKYRERPLKADEGGLAPAFPNESAMIEDAVAAIEAAGYKPGKDVALAIDLAASHFYTGGAYDLGGKRLSSMEMIETIGGWVADYPIISIEDGLAEEDWLNWPALRGRLPDGVLTLGDDLLCTQTQRIQRAVATAAADALLLKVNQVGTVSEAAKALGLARSDGWRVVVSARSGETEDDWLADLATGWQGDFIKVGSVQQSERLAKYNRLIAIEADTGLPLRPL